MSRVKAARRIRCALCHALFTPSRSDRKYCSDTCRFRAVMLEKPVVKESLTTETEKKERVM